MLSYRQCKFIYINSLNYVQQNMKIMIIILSYKTTQQLPTLPNCASSRSPSPGINDKHYIYKYKKSQNKTPIVWHAFKVMSQHIVFFQTKIYFLSSYLFLY